jgi:hypothetical protein
MRRGEEEIAEVDCQRQRQQAVVTLTATLPAEPDPCVLGTEKLLATM